MNELFEQLAKQAGDYVNEVYTPPVRSKTPGKIWEDGHIDWQTQFNEKFAELIVKECALICESRPGPGDDVRSRQHCSEQILEHFGVES